MKTIFELNTHWWYRFLKVVYIFSIVFSVICSVALIYIIEGPDIVESSYYYPPVSWFVTISLSLISIIGIILFFDVIRRAFYYIALGSIFPNKN